MGSTLRPMAEQLLQLIERVLEEAETGDPAQLDEWRESARVAIKLAHGDHSEELERFDKVRYTPGAYSSGSPSSLWDNARRDGVKKVVAMLRATRTELEYHVKPAGPTVDVGALHPWVSGMAMSLWEGGYKRQAVEEAARSIEVQLKAKLGVGTGTGAPLVTEAFSMEAPKPDRARLRFLEFEPGTDNWKSAHEGAGAFGRGCMMRVRNLYTHGHEPSEQEALEALAALSLLARWIDAATVERPD